ncbi:MAG: glycosyltransferase family 2 protein [Lachnospiraceae bacterium]|nr:glycosyltransferase family 2 protein [Lachnospiraceae bacterium]
MIDEIKEKTVDVIIPVYKPEKEFFELLKKLFVQKHCINRILVINTFSCNEVNSYDDNKVKLILNDKYKVMFNDEDKKIYDELVEIHIVNKEEFNHGLTRNYGASFSKADFIVFMTQDAVPMDDTLISELIKPFEDEEVYVSYARQLPRKDCKYVEKYVRSFNYPKTDIVKTKKDFDKMGIKTIFCSDVCAAYKRKMFVKLGEFEKTDFNEDMIFAYKTVMNNKKVYYASKAKVIHSHNYTYMEQLRRNIEIGKNQKEFEHIFGNIKSETEGIKMIKNGIKHLFKRGRWYLIPDLILSSGFKFIGYRIGKFK